jgi:hypothetical protein
MKSKNLPRAYMWSVELPINQFPTYRKVAGGLPEIWLGKLRRKISSAYWIP